MTGYHIAQKDPPVVLFECPKVIVHRVRLETTSGMHLTLEIILEHMLTLKGYGSKSKIAAIGKRFRQISRRGKEEVNEDLNRSTRYILMPFCNIISHKNSVEGVGIPSKLARPTKDNPK